MDILQIYIDDVERWLAEYNGYRKDAPPLYKLRAWLKSKTGEGYTTADKDACVSNVLRISGKERD